MGFPCHRFGEKGFPGTRRSHKQGALWQFRTDFGISSRIVQKVHHFLQGFLRFVFPRHILKRHAGFFLHINLGIAFANAHHTAAAFGHPAEQETKQHPH